MANSVKSDGETSARLTCGNKVWITSQCVTADLSLLQNLSVITPHQGSERDLTLFDLLNWKCI